MCVYVSVCDLLPAAGRARRGPRVAALAVRAAASLLVAVAALLLAAARAVAFPLVGVRDSRLVGVAALRRVARPGGVGSHRGAGAEAGIRRVVCHSLPVFTLRWSMFC